MTDMTEHHFHFQAPWPGGRNGVGTIHCGQLDTRVSIAKGMGGPGVGTNPDEMLLGAAATCYLMTLAAMIERARLPVETMTFDSDLTVDVANGAYQCKALVHRPSITLAAAASEADRTRLKRLVALADEHCMVSNALRGNAKSVSNRASAERTNHRLVYRCSGRSRASSSAAISSPGNPYPQPHSITRVRRGRAWTRPNRPQLWGAVPFVSSRATS